MSETTCREESGEDHGPSRHVAGPLCGWIRRSIGAEEIGCYIWDRALAHSLPAWYEHGGPERQPCFERALVLLVNQVLADGKESTVESLKDNPILRRVAPAHIHTVTLLPFASGAEPVGVLVLINAERQRLENHRATLELLALPTLLALRGYWEVRQTTLQNQELQRNNGYLLTLLKEVEQRRLLVEELTLEVERMRGHLEGILENAAVGLISVDQHGTIQSANEPAAALLRHSKEKMVNRRVVDLVPPVLRDEVDQLLQRALSGETLKEVRTSWPGSEGTRTIRLTLSPFRDVRGKILGAVGILRDTTEHEQTREELARAEKLVALGELVAGVAHEMNNPLTSVLGYASLLLRRVTDPEIRGPLETIAREAERTARIVQNLLLYARQHRPERRPANVNSLLQQVVEKRADTLRANGITVHRHLDSRIGTVSVDPFQLEQVFLNLIINSQQAIQEIRRGGQITLRTSLLETTGQVLIEVEDDGPGVADMHLSRVFDPFFTTKEVGSGTGLGLSICYGIVKEHGGRISVRNRPNGGAVFSLELPLEHGEAAQKETAEDPPKDLLFQKHVLIVDDEPHIRHFFQQALALFQCQVEVASSRKEALEKIRAQSFDLIIYDYKLPDGTGQELASEILTLDPMLANRMLLVTGDSLTTETRAYLQRVPHSLLKPFDLSGLQTALHEMLNEMGSAVGR